MEIQVSSGVTWVPCGGSFSLFGLPFLGHLGLCGHVDFFMGLIWERAGTGVDHFLLWPHDPHLQVASYVAYILQILGGGAIYWPMNGRKTLPINSQLNTSQ